MFRNCAVLASLVAVVVAVTAPSPQAASQFAPLSRINHLTFSGPAALPGVTLAPGTYVFESDPASTNPNLVRVLSRNRQRVFFSGLTMPVVRHSDESSFVTLGESTRGAASRILAWYPGGAESGHEFPYR